MPLTDYQAEVARLLATNRDEHSHLAGGAALHMEPTSRRYSNDLDYFHDSVERVATAFAADLALLVDTGHDVDVEMKQPGYLRAVVRRGADSTKIEWAHDSAWRFMPAMKARWRAALEEARSFVDQRPAEEIGCLYYSRAAAAFVVPGSPADPGDAVAHFGRPGGVLPRPLAQ